MKEETHKSIQWCQLNFPIKIVSLDIAALLKKIQINFTLTKEQIIIYLSIKFLELILTNLSILFKIEVIIFLSFKIIL